MAMMKFREKNDVRWVGTRPGHNGLQLIGNGAAIDDTVDVMQVDAGYVGYITEITISVDNRADGSVWVYWTDEANAIQKILFYTRTLATSPIIYCPIKYWPPLEIGDNHKIRCKSDQALLTIYAVAKGWEE